ncbi:hypothetical protein [Coralloluteibacterium thermophilus]|uniref:Uncharacterized protein n=1 Tax=Coralloluteibacterium thermophilum TaxID=2707049 RepID=A0ABV9NFG3_9GAMM
MENPQLFLFVTILLLATVLAIFAMKFVVATRQARLRAGAEEAYRDLAGRAVAAQRENAEALRALQAGVADLDARLARVEKVLKEVE